MTEVVAKRSEASAGSESGIRVITGREENEMNRNGDPSRRAAKVTRARGKAEEWALRRPAQR